ncbi:hypothetical protein [Flexivirga alba]|uniref:Htaa domain-containing protein n=1 Tax=Flexivirga alba TaxID=702742 RepID=A0ABW2ADJ4_9MICO
MKRNTALFGASLVAGVAAASGLIATGTASSAAAGDTFYGVAWADGTSGQASGWTTGAYADPYGYEFSGTASAGSGTFKLAAGGATVTVKTTCVAGKPSVLVAGGGATGVHTGGSVPLATFTGLKNAQGTVTFASTKVAGHTAGAYINFAPGLDGTHVALAGADCAAAPTSTPPTSTPPTTTPPTTAPPTSTSTTNPPTSTGTNPPSSTTTNPPTTAPTTPPPTTEPPTPTPTTTTLPVTG